MNALRTCVYIYIWQFSSFRVPPFFFHKKMDKILEVGLKWPLTVTRRAKQS